MQARKQVFSDGSYNANRTRIGRHDCSSLPENPRIVPMQPMHLYVTDGSTPSADCRSSRAGYAQQSCDTDMTKDMHAGSGTYSLLTCTAGHC